MNYLGSTLDPTFVYWIHLLEHRNILRQGYVGISKDPYGRFLAHIKGKENTHLKYAIDKYGVDNIQLTVLSLTTLTDALTMERNLRPEPAIGWNLAAGGGLPPSQKGAKRSEATTELCREAGRIGGPLGYEAQIESMGKGWWLKNVCGAGGKAACNNKTPEDRSVYTKGKRWYNNGMIDKRYLPDSVPDGFTLGRLFKPNLGRTFKRK